MSVNFYLNNLSICSCDEKFKLPVVIASFLTFKGYHVQWQLRHNDVIGDVMLQDDYHMTSKFNCFGNWWNFIAWFLGVDKWWLLLCHTTISGATTNTGTSTIYYVNLKLYVTPFIWLTVYTSTFRVSLTPDNPRWVGAWWIGFIISGILAFIVALPLAGFPKSLPGSSKYRAEKEHEVYSRKRKKEGSEEEKLSTETETPLNYKQILKSVKVLVMNPTFMFLNLAAACEGKYSYLDQSVTCNVY